jgi:hypothetical protein
MAAEERERLIAADRRHYRDGGDLALPTVVQVEICVLVIQE